MIDASKWRRAGAPRALALAVAIAACGAPAPVEGAAREASLFAAAPDRTAPLPAPLAEVSGLAATADGRLLGHDDERAVVREIDPATGAVVKSFSVGDVRGDFEGIAVAEGGDIYLLTSNGLLFRFREAADGARAPFEMFDTGLGGICEAEGLAYLKSTQSLIVACKSMLLRSMRNVVTLHAWSVRTKERAPAPWRSLRMEALAAAAGVEGFHPSSVEIDPATGRTVLIAGRESAVVELSADGAIANGRRLGTRHRQPEGAAVLPDGSLLIADEAKDSAPAQLARYPRRHD